MLENSEIQDLPDIRDLARRISELDDVIISSKKIPGVENKHSPGTFNVSFATCPSDSASPRTTFVYLDCSDRLYQELVREVEKLTGSRAVPAKRGCSLPEVAESTRFSGESRLSDAFREMIEEYGRYKSNEVASKNYF